MNTTSAIEEKAQSLGFDAVAFAGPSSIETAAQGLKEFLEDGHQGTMDWLARHADRRGDPRVLWPDVRTVILLAVNYGPATDPLAQVERRDQATISVYAQGDDYHDVIKKRLKVLGRWMIDSFGGDIKVFVDTAPVMEKPLAMAAGIGWQGKHTNLVSRDFGSWLFLGSIFTTLELATDESSEDHCGACRKCLDVCPTAAFPAPYKLDARRCISYLTIEHKGFIPDEFRKPMGNRIYGCDDCLAVCPWNKFAEQSRETKFHPREELTAPLLSTLADLDDPAFRLLFSKSPIKRIGRDRFVRNVMIAIGNSDDISLVPSAKARLKDVSPLVRGMAVWALSQLVDAEIFDELCDEHCGQENDERVRKEWLRPVVGVR